MAHMDSSKWEKTLQELLVQAVLFGHLEAVEQAANALKEHFGKYVKSSKSIAKIKKTTGPLELDFIIGWGKVSSKHKPLCKSHSPLMMALEVGEDEAAKKLIDLRASVGFKNKDGLTALHIACNKGKTDIVKLLLSSAKEQNRFCQKKGAKKDSDCEVVINAKERPQGWTPLMYAVKGGHRGTMEELMQYEFLRYDIENKKKQNVCHIAARAGKKDCLELLHAKLGDDISPFLTADKKNWNLLHQVCCCGDVEIFQWLLETIPEFKTRDKLNQKSVEYRTRPSTTDLCYTPLLLACDYKQVDIVQELAKLGADLVDFAACCHSSNGHGFTGLHIAAVHNADNIAQILIEAGCPLDVVDENGDTVLHVANIRSSGRIATLITEECHEKKIDLERVKNKDGKLPSEVDEAFIIPPEIKKLGKEAIEIYRRALDEGSDKIPYCGLLILGKQEVGKTSLYKQLVGKEFSEVMDSTRGIDNNTVDTVDRRSVAVNRKTGDKWLENKKTNSSEQISDAVAGHLADNLPPKPSEEMTSSQFKEPSEYDLLKQINHITNAIISEKKRAAEAASRRMAAIFISEPLVQPSLASAHAPIPSHDTQPVHKQPPSPKIPRPEKPPPSLTPSLTLPQPKPPKEKPPPAKPSPAPKELPSRPEPRASKPPPVDHQQPKTGKKSEPIGLGPQGRRKVNEVARGKKFHKKEPQLVLNTLDFAGQERYRPMHHCFISRRAMYMVVFKIPDILSKELQDLAIADIRYWIHSIHAHIYPPDDKTTSEEDEKINRIFLVGTHRNGHSDEELKEIDELIKKRLIKIDQSHLVNHVHCRESTLKYFFPVENSIDIKANEDNYLEDSGTKDLQDTIKSKDLPFLNDDHPIKWLKFEECLDQCDKKKALTPVMTVEDVKKLAVKCSINDEPTQDLALTFFHDTGKIIYLKHLSRLFLKKEERQQLQNFIVLRPQWLMSVMRVIIELGPAKKGKNLTGSQVQCLEDNGIADSKLLATCWEKYISSGPGSPELEPSSCFQLHHLCLILQAYCLIYPITTDVTDVVTTVDVNTADATDVSAANATSEVSTAGTGNGATGDALTTVAGDRPTDQKYMIPYRLPDTFNGDDCLELIDNMEYATFYFDFYQFLPDQIYHRLICLAIARADPPCGCYNQYSCKKCNFFGLEETNWVIEIEESTHRLKIKAVMGDEGIKPVEFITIMHEKFLYEICKESGLKGLAYYGAPDVKCKCGKELHCVEYKNGKEKTFVTSESGKVKCTRCRKKCDVNALMKDKDQDPSVTSSIAATKKATPTSQPQIPTVERPQPVKHCDKYWQYIKYFNIGDHSWKLEAVVSDNEIVWLAKDLLTWETELPALLKLTPTDINDIHSGIGDREPLLKRKRALQIWKSKNRLNATFESLLDICLRGGDSKTAENICVYLRDQSPEAIGPLLSSLPHLEQQLEWVDLCEIAHHMLEWEERLCTHLGLTEVDIHDIKAMHFGNPPLQRREALRRWQSNQGFRATYKNLHELFVLAGHSQCAKALYEVLRKKSPTASS